MFHKSQEDGLLYVASFTSVIKRTLRICKEYVGENYFTKYQYLDLGCGKGKSIIYYLENVKEKVRFNPIGIEYDEKLCNTAKKNIFKICNYNNNQVKVALDTATNFEKYISTNNLLIYLYNSFQGKTLDDVLSLLSKYNHILIYIDPVEKNKLKKFKYNIIAKYQGKYNANTWLIAKKKNND